MSELADLHRDVGELRGTVAALMSEVSKLREQVETLNAVLNQGRGMKYFVFLLPAIIGATSGGLSYFGLRLTVGH